MTYTIEGIKFIEENKEIYIEYFAKMLAITLEELTEDELKSFFKSEMLNYKNVIVDMRYKIFKDILKKAVYKANCYIYA